MNWIRGSVVAEKLSLSGTGFKYFRERHADFPKPIVLGTRHIVWDEEAVDKWMKDKSELLTSTQEVHNERE